MVYFTKQVLVITFAVLLFSCSDSEQSNSDTDDENQTLSEEKISDSDSLEVTPEEKLKVAYQLFKEGNDEASVMLANEVLELGYKTGNDTLIGGALASLCRNSQRSKDTAKLAALSEKLAQLATSSGNQKWMMIRAHMNAEMWRLVGDMDKAETYYDESMEISAAIGAKGMYTIDHFNKSFVSTAQGNYKEARTLISKYYALRKGADPLSKDAYGLIALAYLLEQEGNLTGAHEVATVTRRLFKEQNIFPEPPDEIPLLKVEEEVKSKLDDNTYQEIIVDSSNETVDSLLDKYLSE